MRRTLFVIACAFSLSACGEAEYAYCYDPLHGPRGYYVNSWDRHPPCPAAPAVAYFAGPYSNGYREPYYAGPYPAAAPLAAAPMAVVTEPVRP